MKLFPDSVTQPKDHDHTPPEPVGKVPSEAGDLGAPSTTDDSESTGGQNSAPKAKDYVIEEIEHAPSHATNPSSATQDKTRKQPHRGVEPFDQAEREAMEKLLEELRGHLGAVV